MAESNGENVILAVLIVLVLVVLVYNLCGNSHPHVAEHKVSRPARALQDIVGPHNSIAPVDTVGRFRRGDDEPVVMRQDPFLQALKNPGDNLDAYDML